MTPVNEKCLIVINFDIFRAKIRTLYHHYGCILHVTLNNTHNIGVSMHALLCVKVVNTVIYNTPLLAKLWVVDFTNAAIPFVTLRGVKVSMLTHTIAYPHISLTICNHQTDSPPYNVWPDVRSGDLQVWKNNGYT